MPDRRLGVLCAVAALLAGCSTVHEVPVPKPVIVPGPTRYVPLPADTTADCDTECPALKDGASGGALLEGYRACRARAVCRDGQVESIRRLQPVPAEPAKSP